MTNKRHKRNKKDAPFSQRDTKITSKRHKTTKRHTMTNKQDTELSKGDAKPQKDA